MQQTLGYSPVVSGLAFLPVIAMVVLGANLSNVVLLPRVGPKPLVTGGMLLAAGALVWLTRIGVHSSYATAVLGPLLAAGLGFGFTVAPSMNTGTFGVAPQDAGVASATLNTGQQIGGSVGTSLLNTIFASAVAHYLAGHLSPATLVHGRPAASLTALSLIHGYTTGFWVAAVIFGAGAVICGTLFRFGPLRAAETTASTPAAPSSTSAAACVCKRLAGGQLDIGAVTTKRPGRRERGPLLLATRLILSCLDFRAPGARPGRLAARKRFRRDRHPACPCPGPGQGLAAGPGSSRNSRSQGGEDEARGQARRLAASDPEPGPEIGTLQAGPADSIEIGGSAVFTRPGNTPDGRPSSLQDVL
jgi:hypothetical protein